MSSCGSGTFPPGTDFGTKKKRGVNKKFRYFYNNKGTTTTTTKVHFYLNNKKKKTKKDKKPGVKSSIAEKLKSNKKGNCPKLTSTFWFGPDNATQGYKAPSGVKAEEG